MVSNASKRTQISSYSNTLCYRMMFPKARVDDSGWIQIWSRPGLDTFIVKKVSISSFSFSPHLTHSACSCCLFLDYYGSLLHCIHRRPENEESKRSIDVGATNFGLWAIDVVFGTLPADAQKLQKRFTGSWETIIYNTPP